MKRTYETQKMQAQLRADNRQIVHKEEYDALCELRDGAHEALKLKMLKLHNNYQDLQAVNSEQLNRLTRMMLEVEHLKTHVSRVEDREKFIAARAVTLEGKVAELPVIKAENEALKAELEEIRMRLESAYPARFSTPPPGRDK